MNNKLFNRFLEKVIELNSSSSWSFGASNFVCLTPIALILYIQYFVHSIYKVTFILS